MWKWKKKNERMGIVNIKNVWVLSGDEDGREMRVGILKWRKEKEKWKEDMKRGVENEIKINGDGYGKNKLVEEKMGIGVELTKWIRLIFYLPSKNRNNKKI